MIYFKYLPSLLFAIASVVANGAEDNSHEKERHLRPSSSRKLAYYPYRSPPFQIQSTEYPDLCMEAESITLFAPVSLQECDEEETKQKWVADDYGRYHTESDGTLCLSNKRAKLVRCWRPRTYKNMLAWNAFSNTLRRRQNGTRSLGISLPAEIDSSVSVYKWKAIPSLFVTMEDLPLTEFQIKSTLNSLCLTSGTKDETPHLEECDSSKNHQIFELYRGSVFRNSKTSGQKCLFKGPSWSLKSGTGGCFGKKSSFMYDAVTSSIIHRRGGAATFTVDVETNQVILTNQDPSRKELQQFSLVAP